MAFSSGRCSLRIVLDSVDLALGPRICRVKSSLGDSDAGPWLKNTEVDERMQIKEFRESTPQPLFTLQEQFAKGLFLLGVREPLQKPRETGNPVGNKKLSSQGFSSLGSQMP